MLYVCRYTRFGWLPQFWHCLYVENQSSALTFEDYLQTCPMRSPLFKLEQLYLLMHSDSKINGFYNIIICMYIYARLKIFRVKMSHSTFINVRFMIKIVHK